MISIDLQQSAVDHNNVELTSHIVIPLDLWSRPLRIRPSLSVLKTDKSNQIDLVPITSI